MPRNLCKISLPDNQNIEIELIAELVLGRFPDFQIPRTDAGVLVHMCSVSMNSL